MQVVRPSSRYDLQYTSFNHGVVILDTKKASLSSHQSLATYKFFSFEGRIGRWHYFLVSTLIDTGSYGASFLIAITARALFGEAETAGLFAKAIVALLSWIVYIASTVATVAATVKRGRDMGFPTIFSAALPLCVILLHLVSLEMGLTAHLCFILWWTFYPGQKQSAEELSPFVIEEARDILPWEEQSSHEKKQE
jgi:uncharacterized membrane protein YhaH (DUF805 family)